MSEFSNQPSPFLKEVQSTLFDHIEEEDFGVAELAEALAMSRSNLLRKIKKETDLSASQYIRKLRLERSRELLRDSDLGVSEIAFAVGFNSVSYFIKCFREEYGQSPGKMGGSSENLEEPAMSPPDLEAANEEKKKSAWAFWPFGLLALVLILGLWYWLQEGQSQVEGEKSIAILPFKNESSDSANLYFVNGLMESTLRNLQKIEGLRVSSRTSAEKYRNSPLSSPEIAEELQVQYLIEGSGQKLGDQVLLHIKLIDAQLDKPLWTEMYRRKVTDIFDLQQEIAEQLALETQVFISPQAREQIAKKPTDNIQAYDYYLQALDPYFERSPESLPKAIACFKKAVAEDEEFALAYADMAVAYYLLDLYNREKQFTEAINKYSDQALLYDPKSDISLLAKACYYLQVKDYRLALPHLQKALEYNPNSAAALRMLAEFYAYFQPNTARYLEYALKGIQLDGLGADSISASFSFIQLSNALLQTGFFKEAERYAKKARNYYPDNPFASYLLIFIELVLTDDWSAASEQLEALWLKDSSRNDVLQDLAKVYYGQGNMERAYYYFQKLVQRRGEQDLDIYIYENAKIAYVYREMAYKAEADSLFADYINYCENNPSKYLAAQQAVRYAYEGNKELALQYLADFANEEYIQYWFLLLEREPLMADLRKEAEFQRLYQKIEDQFWANHARLKQKLEREELL